MQIPPEVTFLVPAYNEELNLPVVVDGILREARSVLADRFEILVYEDCSRDSCASVADDLAARHPEVRVLHNSVNRGLAFAMIESLRCGTPCPVVWPEPLPTAADPTEVRAA